MNEHNMAVPGNLEQHQKIQLVFRLEHGALGPEGRQKIEDFCRFATHRFADFEEGVMVCRFIPRKNMNEAETTYYINQKRLSRQQAAQYLQVFNKNLDETEEKLHQKLLALIESYMGR